MQVLAGQRIFLTIPDAICGICTRALCAIAGTIIVQSRSVSTIGTISSHTLHIGGKAGTSWGDRATDRRGAGRKALRAGAQAATASRLEERGGAERTVGPARCGAGGLGGRPRRRSYRAISARNSSPKRSSFACPTPFTSKNSASVRGKRSHISRSVASENTM